MTATTADSARGPGGIRSAGPSGLAADRAFIGGCALLFAACTVATVRSCWSTSPRMPMPGDSLREAVAFVGAWAVMMVAMMLPSFLPAFLGYRRELREVDARSVATQTVLAGVGYFLVWTSVGAIVYLLSVGVIDYGDAVARPGIVSALGRRGGLPGRGCGSAHGVEGAAAGALPDGAALRTGALGERVERLAGWRALRVALLSVLRGVHVGAAGIRNDGPRRRRGNRCPHHSRACCEEAGTCGAGRRHRPPCQPRHYGFTSREVHGEDVPRGLLESRRADVAGRTVSQNGTVSWCPPESRSSPGCTCSIARKLSSVSGPRSCS